MVVLHSMANGMRFDFRGDRLAMNIAELDAKVHGAVSAIVDYQTARAEGQLKAEAPWTDRTSAARSGLHAISANELRAWTIVLAHAVNYGIWLETRRDFHGQYAVILPVLVQVSNDLMAQLENLFGKV